MTLVVKLGGEVLAGPARATLATELAALWSSQKKVVVVHGGGPQTSELQERLGQKPRKIAGRRVTDEGALDAIKMMVCGKLNVELCAALVAAGLRPVGLHGASSLVVEARRRPPKVLSGAGPEPVDLGLVGDVVGVGHELLALLLGAGHVPVVACLGCARDGSTYNINADVVANGIAVGLAATALVLVTGAPGVLRDVADPSSRLPRLSRAASAAAVADGTVTEGMIPKLEEAFLAIDAGVGRVHIVGQLAPGDLARALAEPGSVGTVLEP
ncbi:MAG: acetylglutamate kinase [Myxococcales bacterium]|nr:acetylglutamate kinase [Myxococcales bacterium]